MRVLFCSFGQLSLTAVSGLQWFHDEIVLRTVPSPVMSLAGSPAGACICSSSACLVLSAWVVMVYVCQYTRTVSCILDACKVQTWGPLPSPAINLHNINNRKKAYPVTSKELLAFCLPSKSLDTHGSILWEPNMHKWRLM